MMQTGYYSAAAGMATQFQRLDIVANNIANTNTNGFKRSDVIVGDFMRIYQQKRDALPLDNNSKEGAKFFDRALSKVPQITEAYRDFSVGAMRKTDNTFDVALNKEGLFFAINTPDGIRLTRDGAFSLNSDGVLVTKQGYEVLSEDYFDTKQFISMNTQDAIAQIDKNGQIYTNLPQSVNLVPTKKLMIISPDSLKHLQAKGDGLYQLDDRELLASVSESGAVMQGFVESSNVNAITQMSTLIETNRLVGMYQKVMDSQMNDLNRDAIEKIATTRS